MLRTVPLVASFVLAFAHAGCGGPPPGDMGSVAVGDVVFEYGDLGGAHVYGSSPCPQPVGSILVTNTGSAPVTVEVRTSSTQLYFEGGGPVAVGPGESIEVLVNFNCSSTADISTTLTVAVTPDGGTESTGTIPFALDIQGAP